MARTLGADAVEMSTVPEVIVARELDINVMWQICITIWLQAYRNKTLP
jgi:purine nucleoside phosphorylase